MLQEELKQKEDVVYCQVEQASNLIVIQIDGSKIESTSHIVCTSPGHTTPTLHPRGSHYSYTTP